MFNVVTPSNAKQRVIAKSWSGDDLVAEDCPFQCEIKGKKGHYQICALPWVFVDDVTSHIMRLLDTLDE